MRHATESSSCSTSIGDPWRATFSSRWSTGIGAPCRHLGGRRSLRKLGGSAEPRSTFTEKHWSSNLFCPVRSLHWNGLSPPIHYLQQRNGGSSEAANRFLDAPRELSGRAR